MIVSTKIRKMILENDDGLSERERKGEMGRVGRGEERKRERELSQCDDDKKF